MTERAASEVTVVDLDELSVRATIGEACGCGASVDPCLLRALIHELRAHREREATGGWIACAERMPETGRHVIVCSSTEVEPFEAFQMPDFAPTHRWQFRNGSYCAEDEVTHWKPLPEKPEGAV